MKEVAAREGAKVIIYDDEYTAAVAQAETEMGKLRALGTNPDKVIFPEYDGRAAVTKLDLVNYYRAVADGALRGVFGRPM
ncbi:hypothetical protein PXH80_34100, partial [Mycolicibacterium smegmatis]|nr:hypothetical protein [Mycolicibacterium smegmatis]